MKKIFLLTIIKLQIYSVNFVIPKIREQKQNFSIAVIIPCYHGHFQFLENLLVQYTKQTQLPDQIVISISESNKIPETEISKLESLIWPFQVKILTTDAQQFAGQNRNKALIKADCDIIVCQDADDLPHPQRIEIIKYAFDNFDIQCLMHLSSRDEAILDNNYKLDEKIINNADIFNLESIETNLDGSHGTVSGIKKLFLKYKWSKIPFNEDVLLSHKIIKKAIKYGIIKHPLYFYNKKNSSATYKSIIKKTIGINNYDN